MLHYANRQFPRLDRLEQNISVGHTVGEQERLVGIQVELAPGSNVASNGSTGHEAGDRFYISDLHGLDVR